jgi:DNA repair exonuclease SbcCD nuclease subunit
MIKYIVHLSDLHVRTTQLHEHYKKQFKIFLKEINEELVEKRGLSVDEIRFALTGDIVHQKINISNEQMLLISWFFKEITKIGKLIIIPGNHDFLENNMERVDSITPIVKLLNNDRISYYKDSGVYSDDNINWVVYSLYQHNQRPEYVRENDKLYVGLFHSPVQGLSTDLGFTFDNAYDKLNFVNCDIVLCGDIHKRTAFPIPNGGKGIMIGSFLQMDFAETVKHHGYGLFNIDEDEYTFHDLPNEQPYLHFTINDINDIENEKELLVNFG